MPVLELVLSIWLLPRSATAAAAALCQTGLEAHSQVLHLRWPNPFCEELEGHNLPVVFRAVNLLRLSVHTNGNLTSV